MKKRRISFIRRAFYAIKMSFTRIKNRKLLKKYPFLNPVPKYDPITDSYDNRNYEKRKCSYNFESTFADDFPLGWWKAFGEQMCDEIKEELIKYDYLNKYTLCQVKEKYGSLRWYDNGYPAESLIGDISGKYEILSQDTCIDCGKKATVLTTGYVLPFCDDCIKKYQDEVKVVVIATGEIEYRNNN